MTGLHIAVGVALIAANAIAGVWGGVAWFRDRPTIGFWYALRVAQVTVVLQVAVGLLLVFSGRESPSTCTTSTARCPCWSPSSPS